MEFNFQNQVKDYEEKYSSGSSFKLSEGQNKVRLLSETILSVGEYKGQETRKFACYILDRKDGKVKLAFFPKTIIGMIGDLQMSEEYSFKEVPMPYDITITAKNAGSKEVEYSIQPARENTELTETELKEYEKQTPIKELVDKISKKQKELPSVDIQQEGEEVAPDDLPF